MPGVERADIAVVGGGIVGLATAHAILAAQPAKTVVVLEKEQEPGRHQTGHNSGVIHTGVYYRPGSMKARTVAAGRAALLAFCRDHAIRYRVCGKVIVAVDDSERSGLQELERRARSSSVRVEMVGPAALAELEPHAVGVAALHLPDAAIVDFGEVCATLARLLREGGGVLRSGCRVRRLAEGPGSVVVETDDGELEVDVAVNCAGLHSDTLASASSGPRRSGLRIVPFRGEYRNLVDGRAHLVRSLIYPVPDPRFPFLGAHFTSTIGGHVHAGPNAVLALAREGYSWSDVDVADTWDLVRFPGFRRLAARHWRTGAGEVLRSLSEAAFVKALQRLVPEVVRADLTSAPAGVRAQAVDAQGNLLDDFVLEESARVVHVLNAPSPAATASLEIGRLVAEKALARL